MARHRNKNPFIPLLIGGVIGSTAALMFSPSSGKENRTALNNNINRILYKANEQKNILIRDSQRFAKNIISKAEDIYNKSAKYTGEKYFASSGSIDLEIRSLRNAINAAVETYKTGRINRSPRERRSESNEAGVNEMITDFEDEKLPKHEGMGRRTG